MQIPDEAFWGALGVLGGLAAWLTGLERRLGARLTREEHKEICEDRQAALTQQLANIHRELVRSREESNNGRAKLYGEMNALALRVERLAARDEWNQQHIQQHRPREVS